MDVATQRENVARAISAGLRNPAVLSRFGSLDWEALAAAIPAVRPDETEQTREDIKLLSDMQQVLARTLGLLAGPRAPAALPLLHAEAKRRTFDEIAIALDA